MEAKMSKTHSSNSKGPWSVNIFKDIS